MTFAALAALWWSHRLHCLDRAKFHRAEIARCLEQQVIEMEKSLSEQIAIYNRTRAEITAKLERQRAEFKSIIDEHLRAALKDPSRLGAEGLALGASRSQRWEDQSVYDSMAQGFLVVPAPGADMFSRPSGRGPEALPPKTANQHPREPDALDDAIVPAPEPPKAVEKELDEPDLVTPYESKAAALSREIVIHGELADKYLRAIYRPWLRVDESALSESNGR